jgi:hypothetical protein
MPFNIFVIYKPMNLSSGKNGEVPPCLTKHNAMQTKGGVEV